MSNHPENMLANAAKAAVKRKIWKKIIKILVSLSGTIIPFLLIMLLLFSVVVTNNSSQTEFQSPEQVIELLIQTATKEVGTVGGDKYSTWYHGSPTGLSWCSMFVSWCANEVGLIEQDIIPKEQLCYSGIQWFKQRNQFQYTDHYGGSGYIPKRGDIIYFTWDSVIDPPFGHVGIVMFTEGDNVITIEGNTNNNRCAIRTRNRLSSTVLGYGTPAYDKVSSGKNDITIEGNSVSEIVWNFFKSKGFTDEATAGVMGNIHQESSMNPAAEERNGAGEGRGLCQWSFGRKTRLFERAEAAGKPWTDIEIQLTLLWDELNGLDATTKNIMDKRYGGLDAFRQSTDIAWAVEAFEKSFERAGKPMLERRVQYARKYYDQFSSKGG